MKTDYSCKLLTIGLAAFMFIGLAGCATTTSAPDEEITATVASADGSPIVYGVRGQGEPVIVFVHCWTCDHTFWDKQINYFSKHHRVVWLDLAGHGESGSRRQHYTMQAFGQDVAAVVNKVGAQKVILVGHSMGGPVVVEAAELLGDRVAGIVGVDTFYTPFEYPSDQEKITAFVKPFETDFRGASEQMVRSMFTPQADPAAVEAIVAKFSATDPSVGVSAMYDLFSWNAQHAAVDLAYFSKILYNINAAPTGKELPANGHVSMVKNVGHFIPQMKPEAFNQALENIIKTLGKTTD
ncbi:MAG TPA: alpha/beta hydrolase [Gammaproteobacteria bacterium]|nr:alpha/beta hydrolase [Gammaproteobacteria bacterium]